MERFLVAALMLMTGGCATRLLDASADAAVPDAATCTLVPIPLDSLHGDDLNMCPSDLLRVTFRITLDACQPVRPALVAFDSATNSYAVTAQACDGPKCHGPPVTIERTVFLSETAAPRPGNVIVRDGAPGSPVLTTLPIQNTVNGGQCGSVNGAGCRSDAECKTSDPSTRCWFDGSQCERICFDDADCIAGAPHCNLGFCGR